MDESTGILGVQPDDMPIITCKAKCVDFSTKALVTKLEIGAEMTSRSY